MNRLHNTGLLLVCSFARLVAFAFICVANAHGQAVTATLSGRVVDASGGSVGKANLSVTNVATGFTRTAQASDTGEYSIPALPAGDYTVSAEFTGFGKQTKNITLQVGQAANLDFTLTPGGVAEKVEVEATSEVQETTRTQVSTVITERQIMDLPVNGREFIDFRQNGCARLRLEASKVKRAGLGAARDVMAELLNRPETQNASRRS